MTDQDDGIKKWELKAYSDVLDPTDKQKASIVVLIGVMYAVMIALVYLLATNVIAVAPV